MAEKPTYEELERRVQELEKIESEFEVIKAHKQRLEMILSSLDTGLSLINPDYTISWVNDTIRSIFPNDNPVGKTCHRFYESSEHRCDPCPTFEAYKSGQIQKMDKYNPSKKTWYSIISQPVKDEAGQIVSVLEGITEITERKTYEQQILKEKNLLQQVMETSPVGITMVDEKGKISMANARAEEILGLERSDIYKRRYNDKEWQIQDFQGNEYPDDQLPFALVKKTGKPVFGIRHSLVWPDGKKKLLSINATPLLDSSGNFNGMVSALVDITERKKAEAEREKLQAQLNQAQKMESVGRLAGGVAHDFNNMLGVILGHTELALLQADESHDLYADLKEIQDAAKRSADTTKQLLAFARKQTISPKQIDLNDTVEKMLTMLRRLIGEDIDLVWQPGDHLWSVKMDPTQIDQILANLCVNARDAIAGVGKLTIETGRKTFDVEYCNEHPGFIPGDFVLLAVSDNGCGMHKDTLNNLFEPFFTTKDIGKGTGLGLATIYGIVKQNNGFINVYSEPGQGTTFRIYLPRHIAEKDAVRTVPEKKAAAGGSETILLVEDEPTILRMTRMMLERKGYSVLMAATPAEAMEKAKSHSDVIDLLMTDVVMPEMNGRDLAGQITALYPDIRLLFMSGYTANVIAHHGVLDDGVAFIQKPFSMADMTAKVREVLDKASDETQ
jgi:PAS domain S-box-containing protein